MLRVSKKDTTFESLADSGSFPTPDSKLAIALTALVEKSKLTKLDGRLKRKTHENRGLDDPILLTGRQILWIILHYFEISRCRGVHDGLNELMNLR